MPKTNVVTTFYANGKAIFKAEWYEQMSDEKIQKTIEDCESMGYGSPDAFTDTTGRMVVFPKANDSTESA